MKKTNKPTAKSTARPVAQRPVPQRMCVVCRTTAAKRTLTRLVRVPGKAETGEPESVQVDPSGKRNGRGAYLCDQAECWQRALKSDILDKALRATLSDADRERLRAAAPAEG